MDPPFISDSEASFSAANPASYSLGEIWPFSAGIIGEMGSSSGLGLRIGNLGSGFGERDGSVEESTVTEQSGGGGGNGRKRKDLSLEDETSNLVSTITSNGGNVLNDSSAKQSKIEQFDNENNNSKAGGASSSENNKQAEQSCKPSEPPKQDYIHVRARRGQATDSHSLAERARREKISERMKLLQDLVPGCNKIIGKALVLDEIINYIQSLQRQVEFLSMKLETVNSRMSMNPMIEGFHPKDLGAQPFDATGMMFGSQATGEYAQGSQPEWLHMQVGGSFQRAA